MVRTQEEARPAALAAMPAESVVELDVREDLRNGSEPFSRIMAARAGVPEGGALRVRAIFEPVPLYRVMAKQGLAHYTEQWGEEDWVVWFYPEPPADAGPRSAAEATPAAAAATDEAAEHPAGEDTPAGSAAGEPDALADVTVLDVRGLEPPEPLMRTLAALEAMPERGTLVQINVRVPQFLLPQLKDRGYTYEIREQEQDLVRVFIRKGEVR